MYYPDTIPNIQFQHSREPFWLYITREQRFCQTCGFQQKIEHINAFRLNIIWTTSSWLVFLQKCKMSKTSFFGYFGPFMPKYGKMGVLPKNRALSLLSPYGPLTSCRKSEKTNEKFLRKLMTTTYQLPTTVNS